MPKSPLVLIRSQSQSLMTWMIRGYPHDLGTLISISIYIYIYTPTNILINIPVSPFTHPLHPTEVTWAIHDLHGNAGWWSLELMEKLQKTITFLGGQLWICVDFLIMMLASGSPLKIGIARGILKFTGSMWASWNWRIQSHDNANQYKRSHRY